MLFNINKEKSLALFKILMAAFLIIAPSFLGLLPIGAEVYLMFAILGTVFVLRIKTNNKIYISVQNLTFVLLIAYAVISSIWADSKEGQLIYIFALGAVTLFYNFSAEYFAENSSEGIRRRLMYMLCFSGALCSVINIFYWVFFIVPVAGGQPFDRGLGTNNILGIFMAICIVLSLHLLKGAPKFYKIAMLTSAFLMLFVFVMSESIIAWTFLLLLFALLLSKRKIKSERGFLSISFLCILIFTAVIICWMKVNSAGKAFSDVFSYAFGNIFGIGGGFWNEREVFLEVKYSETLGVGLLPYLFATSGILGLLSSLFIIIRNIILFIKLKSYESLVGLFITLALMIFPFGENFTVILLWIGICAYNEHAAGTNLKLEIKKNNIEKAVCVSTLLTVISCVLLVLAIIKINADFAYERKDYLSSYELYKVSATINLTDSESCRMAAASIRKAGALDIQGEEALNLIDKAIERDKENLQNIKEKALIYAGCGEYELSAQEYREASHKALIKDEYNLSLAKTLYKIVKGNPKGSSETKRCYEEIISIALSTDDLDLRKEINDIADKALQYTKGELTNEEQVIN